MYACLVHILLSVENIYTVHKIQGSYRSLREMCGNQFHLTANIIFGPYVKKTGHDLQPGKTHIDLNICGNYLESCNLRCSMFVYQTGINHSLSPSVVS